MAITLRYEYYYSSSSSDVCILLGTDIRFLAILPRVLLKQILGQPSSSGCKKISGLVEKFPTTETGETVRK